MWQRIKSSFILKKIFNNVYYKRKLYITKNNKRIKQKLDINLIDFRRFSGRYKEDMNGKTKEYDSYSHRLLFEGLYSNGKRIGEGKEYNDDGNLIFEGEYLDGKKWKGIAKEYDEDTGKLILEYEYLSGKIDGESKEYDKYNGDLLFSGKIKNGKMNGIGTEYISILYEKSDYKNLKHNSKLIKIF